MKYTEALAGYAEDLLDQFSNQHNDEQAIIDLVVAIHHRADQLGFSWVNIATKARVQYMTDLGKD